MPSPKPNVDRLTPALQAIADAGTTARSSLELRTRALDALATVIRFDAALFHALSPRVPLETGVVRGLDLAKLASNMQSWDSLAVELEPLRELAHRQAGVATDRQAFPLRSPGRKSADALCRQLGIGGFLIMHLSVRDAVRSAVMLCTQRTQLFAEADLELLRALVPTLAVADALHVALDDAPRAQAPVRLRCEDQRLTGRQREIVELVAMGHTNEAIAQALGLSPNTLRNHLAEVFRRLSAANRADVVRLAVLRLASGG